MLELTINEYDDAGELVGQEQVGITVIKSAAHLRAILLGVEERLAVRICNEG